MAKSIRVEIIGDASSLKRALGQSVSGVGHFGSSVGRAAKFAAVAAGAAGIGGLVIALKEGTAEWMQHAKVAAQTRAELKSTQGVANVTAKDIDKLASSIMRKSGIDDEAIQSGENLLLTFKNVRNEIGEGNRVFDRATQAAIDLSVAGFGSIESASKLMGKALNDPERGLTALTRAGVTFTESQKETIKSLIDSGHQLEAQKIILREVESQVGGSAEAYGKTLPGQISKLKESFRNLAGEMVGGLMPTLQRGVDAAADFVNRLADAPGLRGKIDVLTSTIHDGFARIDWTALWGDTRNVAGSLVEKIQVGLRDADWRKIGDTLGVAIGKALNFAGQLAKDLTKQVVIAVENIDWHAVGHGFVVGFAKGITGLDSRTAEILIHEFGSGTAAGAFRKTLELGLREEFEKMQLPKAQIAAAMRIVAKLSQDSLVDASKSDANIHELALVIAARVQASAQQAQVTAAASGARVGQSLAAGISSGAAGISGSLGATLAAGIAGAVAAAKAAARIKSPSGLTRDELGKPLGEGIVEGWILGTRDLPSKMSERLRSAIDKARAVVESKQAAFSSAFGRVSDRILGAFDAASGAHKTPAEQQLADVDARRQQEDMTQAVTDAEQRLADVRGDAAATPGDIASAERDLARAREDITVAALQKQAEAERTNYDSRRENLRQSLEDRLSMIETHFGKEGGKIGELTKKITAILKSYDVDFATAGALLGAAFVTGLKKQIRAAGTGAASIDKALDKAAAALSVHIDVHGSVVTENELVETIRTGINRIEARTD